MNIKLRTQVISIIEEADKSTEERLQSICNLLKHSVAHYDWVGFYFRNGEKNELKLGPSLVNRQIIRLFPLEKEYVDKWPFRMKIL